MDKKEILSQVLTEGFVVSSRILNPGNMTPEVNLVVISTPPELFSHKCTEGEGRIITLGKLNEGGFENLGTRCELCGSTFTPPSPITLQVLAKLEEQTLFEKKFPERLKNI